MYKRRVLFYVLGLILVVGVVVTIYLTRRPSADTTETSTLKGLELSARAAFAGACNPQTESQANQGTCNSGSDAAISGDNFINQYAEDELYSKAYQCLFLKKETGELPSWCSMGETSDLNGVLTVTKEFNSGKFPLIFHNGTEQTDGEDTVDISGSITATFVYYKDDKSSSLMISEMIPESLNGGYKGTLWHHVSSESNLSGFLATALPDFDLDMDKSSNTSEFKGNVNYYVDVNISNGESQQLTTFCPNTCTFWNKETLILSGTLKKNAVAGIKAGTIDVNVSHEENYKGTGDATATQAYTWSDDLEVVKEDRRSWNIDLDVDRDSNVNWVGSVSSDANVHPFQKKTAIKTSQLESFYLPIDYWAIGGTGTGGENVASGGEGQGLVAIHMNESNTDGVINRTGTGSYTIDGQEQVSGVFDNNNSKLLVTSVGGKPLNLENRFLIDLYSNQSEVADYYHKVENYIYSPLVMENFIPGFFSADDPSAAGATIIKTPEYKILPRNVLMTNSFGSDDGEVHLSTAANYIDLLTQWFQERGASVTVLQTQNKAAMLAAWESVPEGTMVINFGHGAPGYLMAGQDSVSYWEIREILEARSIKIATFALSSCYSASAEGILAPFTDQIIGSGNYGYSAADGFGNYGTAFGIGANNWHYTTSELAGKITGLFNGSGTCNSNSDQPTEPSTPTAEPGTGDKPITNPDITPTPDGDGSGDDDSVTSNLTDFLDRLSSPTRYGSTTTGYREGIIDAIAADLCPADGYQNLSGIGATCTGEIDANLLVNFKMAVNDLKQSYAPDSIEYNLLNELYQVLLQLQSPPVPDASSTIATIYAELGNRLNQNPITSAGSSVTTDTPTNTTNGADESPTFTTADFPTELPADSQPEADFSWYISPEPFFTDPTRFDPWYEPAVASQVAPEPSVKSTDWATAWSELPVLESLPAYAPDPTTVASSVVETSGWENFVTDTFNFEPAPVELVYADPYYDQAFSYEYNPEPEPLFNDWYDYFDPIEYYDYSYNSFESTINAIVDWAWDTWY